jgi:N-acetylglucosamine-6-phosphate deacetylase
MDATAADLRKVSEYLVSQGVTSWVPTFVPASDENYASAIAAISEAMNGRGARVLGVHYEGPFVNTAQCGALHTEYFKIYSSPADLSSLPLPSSGVRMITFAPEVSGGIELVRELKRRGWVISIGHTRADLPTLDAACEAGAQHMTHFMNAMAPLHHRSPGPIAWGLARDDVTFDCIADGVHLDPFMLRLLLKVKGTGSISLISDAIAAAGRGDGDYQIWGETISVKNGRTANASGSIAGSVISMLDAVRLLHSLGVSYVDLARMASLNPARLLGVDSACGSIEVGKRADLVALDQDNNPVLTIINGNRG